MSMTESRQARSSSANTTSDGIGVSRERAFRETKPSFMTSEFWAMIAGIVVVAVVYNVSNDSSLNLFRASLLATVLAAGYIVSRGFAKSGSRDGRVTEDRP